MKFAVENDYSDLDFLIICSQWVLSKVQSHKPIHSTAFQTYPLERTSKMENKRYFIKMRGNSFPCHSYSKPS